MKKIEIFKQFLKETIREVLKEELELLKEELKSNKPVLEESIRPTRRSFEEFLPGIKKQNKPQQQVKPTVQLSSNPLEKILQQTAMSMTGQDFQNTGAGMLMEESVPIPMQMNPAMMQSIGEIEEYTPSSMNLPNFPM